MKWNYNVSEVRDKEILITPANTPLFVRWSGNENCLQIQLTTEFLQSIAQETLNQNSDRLELLPGFQIRDAQIEAIAMMLFAEHQQEHGVRNERDRLILLLMYGCGLRVSEVCGLTWNDLKSHNDGGKLTVFGKGSKTRMVIVPDWLWGRLKEFEKFNRVNQWMFVSRNENQMERSVVHRMLKRACKRAGIDERTSAHWLRHSHASHSLDKGCNLRLLQQSLGHASVTTTERYLHISPDAGSSQFIDF